MIADLWPLYRLKIVVQSLELRLPHEDELAELARIAGVGVHRPDERPFLTPWTEGGARDRELAVLQGHWGRLANWRVADWALGLGVFRDGRPLGMVTLRARLMLQPMCMKRDDIQPPATLPTSESRYTAARTVM